MTRQEGSLRQGDVNAEGTHYWDGDIWGWRPLWLNADQVADAAYGSYGLRVDSASYLADGYMNQSWRIDTGEGAFVLRVGRSEMSADQVAYEHAFATGLHRQVEVAVAPLPGPDGRTLQGWRKGSLSLFPFVEGVAGTRTPADVRSVETAAVKARFHRAALAHFPVRQRPGFCSVDEHPRLAWTRIKPILERELGGDDRFQRLAAGFDREAAALEAWLDELDRAGHRLTRATIHGDLNPRNLLFRDHRLVAVIDFDGCRVEPIAWEVAQTAVGDPDIDPEVFWKQYLEAGGPLAPEDIGLLGGFARMGCFSELQWAAQDGAARPRVLELLEQVADGLAFCREREQKLRD